MIRRHARALVLAAALAAPAAAQAHPPHLLVATSDGSAGSLASLELGPPWTASTGLEAIGPHARLRHWRGIHYIVNGSPVNDLQAIEPDTWATLYRLPMGVGADPTDIAFVSDTRAYVARAGRPQLLVVDVSLPAIVDSIDLRTFADADGLPDLGRMAVHAGRVYVQVRRLDHAGGWGAPVAPSLIAVIDAVADTVVDVDPGTPGTQAIALAGLDPVHDMQIEGDSLYVVAQGSQEIIDPHGGIEVIDLTSRQSRGFLTTEADLGGHTNAFVLVSRAKGYAVTHTDLTLSSHVTAFARPSGAPLGAPLEIVGANIRELAHDPATGLLYVPVDATDPGVRVVDTATDAVLTPSSIGTGLPAHDVIVVPGSSPGDVPPGDGLAAGRPRPNPFRGSVEIPFRLTVSGAMSFDVLDLSGRRVHHRRAPFSAGEHVVTWDGRSDDGLAAPAGLYLIRMTAATGAVTRRVVRMR